MLCATFSDFIESHELNLPELSSSGFTGPQASAPMSVLWQMQQGFRITWVAKEENTGS